VFEGFTDRARNVLSLAKDEAYALGHDYIGTEHILLGLMAEPEGVAGTALRSLGLSTESVRTEVQNLTGTKQTGSRPAPFTSRAKEVLDFSLREALQLGHHSIGTEHIILGITREGRGTAVQVLTNLGVDPDSVRAQVIALMAGNSVPRQSVKGTTDRTFVSERDPDQRRLEFKTTEGPQCPKCDASLDRVVRYRTLTVLPGVADQVRGPILLYAVYCSQCGITLDMFDADHPR
jgi:ATP-dependent Clp protease ATP-binding subunit ClpA